MKYKLKAQPPEPEPETVGAPTADAGPSAPTAKEAADERVYRKHFADVKHLSSKSGSYSPLPWYLRSVMHLFTPREWQLLTFFIMSGGKMAISWATDREIGEAFAIGHKKLGPYVRRLEELGFIAVKTLAAKRYVIVIDPYEALKKLVAKGHITGDRLEALNDDLAKSKRPELHPGPDAGAGP